ncbi:hypothetical protein [Haloglomus halophilum]|nr:hypothetical protein [Haloglomus halophilum]
MSTTDGALARCLGCGAEFDSVRELCRGAAHAETCDEPGEVFP